MPFHLFFFCLTVPFCSILTQILAIIIRIDSFAYIVISLFLYYLALSLAFLSLSFALLFVDCALRVIFLLLLLLIHCVVFKDWRWSFRNVYWKTMSIHHQTFTSMNFENFSKYLRRFFSIVFIFYWEEIIFNSSNINVQLSWNGKWESYYFISLLGKCSTCLRMSYMFSEVSNLELV